MPPLLSATRVSLQARSLSLATRASLGVIPFSVETSPSIWKKLSSVPTQPAYITWDLVLSNPAEPEHGTCYGAA